MRELILTPHERLTIVSSSPEELVVEVTYGAGGTPPPPHLHPTQDERFVVHGAGMRVDIDGAEREVAAGEAFDIPRGTPHKMWNAGSEPVRATWTTSPAGRTEDWFRSIDRLHREGRVGRNGMPGVLAFAVLLTEYDDVFRLTAGPRPLVKGALAALAPLGRMRGYG